MHCLPLGLFYVSSVVLAITPEGGFTTIPKTKARLGEGTPLASRPVRARANLHPGSLILELVLLSRLGGDLTHSEKLHFECVPLWWKKDLQV